MNILLFIYLKLLLLSIGCNVFLKVIVIFNRCDNDGINCEYFQMWTITDICPKLKDKNKIWSRWYSSFDSPMVCPIDKVRITKSFRSFLTLVYCRIDNSTVLLCFNCIIFKYPLFFN